MKATFKTHAQEQAEAWEALLASPFRGTHVYRPGLMDLCDPTVLRGKPIAKGAEVRIVQGGRGQKKVDPLGKIVYVQDADGNLQSVWKAGLQSKRWKRRGGA